MPKRCVSNNDVPEGVVVEGDVDSGTSLVSDGSKGRRGPAGSMKRKRERYGSCCAVVPSDARRRARLRSCSRIMDVVPGRDVKRDSLRRSISRINDRMNSPFRIRK